MKVTTQRTLIRFASFAGGLLVALALIWQWQLLPFPNVGVPILAFVLGCLGVVVGEFVRPLMPAQYQLDADEVDALSDIQVRRLLMVRRIVSRTALLLGFMLPVIIFPVRDVISTPVFAIIMGLVYAFWVWLIAEILLSLHPRQRILKFALRRRSQ